MHILLAFSSDVDPQPWQQALQEHLPEARVSVWEPGAAATGADYAVVWRPAAEVFASEPGLRAVFNIGAGVDALLALPTLPADLPVVRLEDAGMSLQMAEYVLHALWERARDLQAHRQDQQRAHWGSLPVTPRRGWTVGVMGLGQVGQRVAQATREFGYPTAGWSRSPRQLDGIDGFAGAEQLPAFLARTRVLVNVLPLTSDTRGILNAALFAQLPRGAHLISVGRGEHLVDEDLLHALDDGQIASATLDVFNTEPLPAEHPFWRHPAVTVTPHIAARTLLDESAEQIAGKIRQTQAGEPVTGLVERGRGY